MVIAKLLKIISYLLEIIAELTLGSTQAVRLIITARLDGEQDFEEVSMAFKVPIDRKASFAFKPVDKNGNPALIDGLPVCTFSNPALGVLTTDAAGVGHLTPVGPLGTAQLQVEADADIGVGVQKITALLDVELVAGTAVGFGIEGTLDPVAPVTPEP